ncbi:MAG TPA: hypothetical protein VFT41_06640 [Gemmatimonadaceae bacterium]|nr:hypothetical protein [Gemmatimonadaceae bacterium]
MITLRSIPTTYGVPATRDASPVFRTDATVVVPTTRAGAGPHMVT